MTDWKANCTSVPVIFQTSAPVKLLCSKCLLASIYHLYVRMHFHFTKHAIVRYRITSRESNFLGIGNSTSKKIEGRIQLCTLSQLLPNILALSRSFISGRSKYKASRLIYRNSGGQEKDMGWKKVWVVVQAVVWTYVCNPIKLNIWDGQ